MSTPLVDSIIAETAPAELLRQVAARMLELAGAATPGAWHEMHLGSEGCIVHNDGGLRERKTVARFGSKEWKADHADAAYVAGMQPAVALAVAAWLDALGREIGEANAAGEYGPCPCNCPDHLAEALAVARGFMDATGWRP